MSEDLVSTELAAYAARHFAAASRGAAYIEALPGLYVMQRLEPSHPNLILHDAALCVVLQGAKRVTLGDQSLEYGEMSAVIVSTELPLVGEVVSAGTVRPYLALSLTFDMALLTEVVSALPRRADAAGTDARSDGDGLALFRQRFDGRLADCLLRLLKLAETPEALPVLRPAILKELYYWLLAGENGAAIARLALADSHTRRIGEAIALLRARFDRPVKIEELACAARMGLSSFHHHFKTLTAMTPLQFQKSLRLIEARRLMLSGEANATTAAFRVGYESPTQFSREYARMFGAPPRRDTAQQRVLAG